MHIVKNTLICPVCKETLFQSDKSLKCINNHTYDIAKQQYVNLLPVNQKRSKDPGDDKHMISARRNFLQTKFYDPLILKITEIINSFCKIENLDNIKILDAGCGEGYYMRGIKSNIKNDTEFIGFDISKSAIIMAAKRYKNMCFFVASIKQIPIESNSIDFIVSIFSPIGEKEFNRILKKGAKVIIVTPNSNHLKGLTNVIYPQHNEHKHDTDDFDKKLFEKIDETSLSFDISLSNNSDIMNLFTMTPYYYSTSKEKSQKLESFNKLDVFVDFNITVLQKR